ncbi:DUF7525 family protein [Natrononativus amylolyticus]|uniref:DUF7525 family protein n=1 Tax=Natrononativus amylolyticus TaxID=2963434 RepID=UPI0020CC039E|nr:hypothetical protein [Natrononativus amylolyticus]
MAAPTETTTDRGVGLALLLGTLTVLGALLMFTGAPDIGAAWGFAGAVTFGVLAVVGIHLDWD